MATRASTSKFNQHRTLEATADRAASEVTSEVGEVTKEEGGRCGPVRKAALAALSEKVWVGAAPTGKKPAAMLKRKPSAEEVSMVKSKKSKTSKTSKKSKGKPVVKSPPSEGKVVTPSTRRLKAPTIDMEGVSSADEFKVPVKSKVKQAKINAVTSDSEDSGTESSSDDKSASETESEGDHNGGLAGDSGSVKRQLQAEPKLSPVPAAVMPTKISHREKVQIAETPTFCPVDIKPESPEHTSLTSQTYFSTSTDLLEQVGKPLALLSQSKPLKDIIHETIDRTLEAVVFVSGFVANRVRNGCAIVIAAAEKLGYEEIESRCKVDTHYVDEIAKVADGRICSLRKTLKETASTHIVAQYRLQPGCKALVIALLAGRSYIFPGDMTNPSTIQRGAPYGHPIFAVLIAEVFFKTKMSLGNVYPQHFTNSVEYGDAREVEVPPAMLELVATATLKSIFDYNVLGFHRTLYSLYKDAIGRALKAPIEDCDVDFSAMQT